LKSSLYIDTFAGVAGDMLLAALIDLGVDAAWLDQQLHRLPVGEFDLEFTKTIDRGISGKHLQLAAPQQIQYRHLQQIAEIIRAADYSGYVTENSLRAFSLLAEAESQVHGCSPDQVHFHEVGALDTIIDICGYFLALEKLGQPTVYCSPLPMPSGSINIAHGQYPLPAPAITYLLQGFHVCGSTSREEMVTPTGAALLATSAQSVLQWPMLRIIGTGYGAGTPGRGPLPNLLRIVHGEPAANHEQVIVIEAQMDDVNPEILAHSCALLLNQGALDYYISPIYMKKSRPGFLLTVFCTPDQQEAIAHFILTHTTTLGVRFHRCDRQIIPRRSQQVETPFGLVTVKVAYPPAADPRIAPEYEDCARLAAEHQVPLQQVYTAAQLAWHLHHE